MVLKSVKINNVFLMRLENHNCKYNMEISTEETKILVLQGKEPIPS